MEHKVAEQNQQELSINLPEFYKRYYIDGGPYQTFFNDIKHLAEKDKEIEIIGQNPTLIRLTAKGVQYCTMNVNDFLK